MALRNYQTAISLGTLYEIKLSDKSGLGEGLAPRISVKGGTVSVYFSDSATQPATLSDMNLDKALTKSDFFNAVPVYMAVVQDGGTVSEVILSSIQIVQNLGAIA